MKQFYLLWLSTLFTVPVLAQVPQPALPSVQPFQTYGSGSSFAPAPAAVIHANENRNTIPSSALVGSSGINNYQSDRQQTENDRREYQQILEEAHRDMNRPKPIQYTLPSHAGEPGANCYNQAFGELNNMLSGKAPLNLKRAVFLVENAYTGNTMEYAAFCKHIDNLAQFCRIRMQQEHTDTKDNTALNNLVYRFLSDTLTIKDPATGKKVTHYPVRYNFDDYRGDKDWTSQFVTKLINTNFGQCHSMPLLYNIIADEIGATCYLSTSPSHLFVKYKIGKEYRNVELTNGHMTTDAYVIGSGYVKAEALKNHIYLDTMSDKQAIAFMMQDLGKGYYIKYGFDAFVLQCCDTGLKYYPNDAYGMAIKSDYRTAVFMNVVKQKGNQTPREVLSDPKAYQLYKQMHGMYAQLDNSGYADMPPEAYEDWLKSIDKEKRKQQYDLFLQYQKTHKTNMKNAAH